MSFKYFSDFTSKSWSILYSSLISNLSSKYIDRQISQWKFTTDFPLMSNSGNWLSKAKKGFFYRQTFSDPKRGAKNDAELPTAFTSTFIYGLSNVGKGQDALKSKNIGGE